MLITDSMIEKLDKDITDRSAEVINAKGRIIVPGLIDMHVHLREPGREDEETVLTGTRAAVKGGFTGVVCMPNTEEPIDDRRMVKRLKDIIKKDAVTDVFVTAAITEKREGKKLTDIKGLAKEGVVAISDDGSSVEDSRLMLKALAEAKKNSIPLIAHCEDAELSANGVINQGFMATKMGLRGIPQRSEYERVERDLELAGKADAAIHIAHLSCKESVELIRKAKRRGIKVTAETSPHYFALTEECAATYDTNTKMNPPLRTKEDAAALKEGLADGTIDAIATDHAPHTDAEKDVEFDFAPFGIIGLETALSLVVMELVEKGVLSWQEVVMKMSVNPSRILGLGKGNLKKGTLCDIAIIDPGKEYIYSKDSMESKSKNTPFAGWRLKGKAVHVFVAGKLVMKDGNISI
jgi:dihydroorotase